MRSHSDAAHPTGKKGGAFGTASPEQYLSCPPPTGRLVERGGFLILGGLLDTRALCALSDEARERRPRAGRAESRGSTADEWRGGVPSRAYWASPGGPIQWQLFGCPAAAERLSAVSGLTLRISGAGSFSYYAEAGDFLGLHRDVALCDVALLTCIEDTQPARGRRGALRVYPDHSTRPLSALRGEQNPRCVEVDLSAGESALLLGGVIPHEVTPMAADQQRTMSVMCFVAVDNAAAAP